MAFAPPSIRPDGTQTTQLSDGRRLSYKLDPATFRYDDHLPVILLASPTGFPLSVWDSLVFLLLEGAFRVVRYDPPGVGNSDPLPDPSKTTFRGLADDVRQLLFDLGQVGVDMWVGVDCKLKVQETDFPAYML
jgi:pimeloyl-ACP methyl ester carboxylesterase